ncbi:MAG TPA: GtrA family protein [Acetobacteraceae bacterium]|nr:GtrA family protein [Acetobacteraceae bacterium]
MNGFLARLSHALPPPLRAHATPARLVLLAEFLRFGVVGVIGFCFDAGTVYATRGVLGLYGAGILSYFVAASVNWGLNRCWTFRGRGNGPAHRQWALFLAANLAGFALNRGTYIALIATSPLCVAYPVLAVAAGSIAGMFCNFSLSRAIVFR